jgi:sugar phosphate permease
MALLQQSVACDPGIAKSSGSDAVLQSVIRKAALRLVPLLTIAYLFNYLDRTSLGFAALTMNQQLGLSAGQFGLAAGGLAFINSIGTAGGFVGPSMMGWLREFSGSYVVGLTAVAVILIAIAATAASMSLKLVGSKE